jgi:Amidohydrolase family
MHAPNWPLVFADDRRQLHSVLPGRKRGTVHVALIAVFCSLPCLPCYATEQTANPSAIAITHVTVIDATGAQPRADMTVVIRSDRVASVMPSRSGTIPTDATQVDGRGKFVIPGLWDMHTHVIEMADIDFPVLLAYGVTGIRNMHNSSLQQGTKLRTQVEGGEVPGPHISLSGPLVDGASYWPTAIKVTSAAEARQAVDTLKAGGADFVKVYTFLSRDAYFAIVEEARRQHISFVGHVPETVLVSEASEAGQRSIEHLDRVLLDCSSRAKALDERFNDAMALWSQPATETRGQTAMIGVNAEMIDTYDPTRCARLFQEFVHNNTWQVPTLVAHYTAAFPADARVRENPALAFIPLPQLIQWRKMAPPSADWAHSELALFKKNSELVGAMHRAGVRILAGTDVGNGWLVPGDSLHHELELLVEAGLTPMQALQSATRDAAEFLGRSEDLGTVEQGKIADLLLLDANPLDDIHNTRKIRAVFMRGRYFDRHELDHMLASAAHAAAAAQH